MNENPRPGVNVSGKNAVGRRERLAGLREAPLEMLRADWRRLYRTEPPQRMRRDLLELALAFKLQEQMLGGLDARARRQLDDLARSLASTGDIKVPARNALKLGAVIFKEWQGRRLEVTVLEKGFAWNGRHWPTLSALARAITGTRWSGPRFFGLTAGGAEMPGSGNALRASKASGGRTGKEQPAKAETGTRVSGGGHG